MESAEIELKTVEEVLDEYVRPLLYAHGGDIDVLRIEDQVVYFRMKGACAGCPSADLTNEELINKELTERIKGLKRAVMESCVSDELIEEALKILDKKKATREKEEAINGTDDRRTVYRKHPEDAHGDL